MKATHAMSLLDEEILEIAESEYPVDGKLKARLCAQAALANKQRSELAALRKRCEDLEHPDAPTPLDSVTHCLLDQKANVLRLDVEKHWPLLLSIKDDELEVLRARCEDLTSLLRAGERGELVRNRRGEWRLNIGGDSFAIGDAFQMSDEAREALTKEKP